MKKVTMVGLLATCGLIFGCSSNEANDDDSKLHDSESTSAAQGQDSESKDTSGDNGTQESQGDTDTGTEEHLRPLGERQAKACELDPIGELGYECRFDEELDECTRNEDCEGDLAFCSYGGDERCVCLRHECRSDADCEDGKACFCEQRWQQKQNLCIESCRSNDDCFGDHRCVSAGDDDCAGVPRIGVKGYRCTTDKDECSSHGQCPKPENENKQAWCVWSTEDQRFTCQDGPVGQINCDYYD